MIYLFVLAVGFALFSIALAGLASSRHLLVLIVALELALAAATLAALANYGFASPAGLVDFLLVVWTIASAEVMCLVAIYRFLSRQGMGADVSSLSEFGEK